MGEGSGKGKGGDGRRCIGMGGGGSGKSGVCIRAASGHDDSCSVMQVCLTDVTCFTCLDVR